MIRVLVIEDDPAIAEIIEYYLTQCGGYAVTAVPDGTAALNAVASPSEPFDIILLDVMLPDLNGVELCSRLRRNIYCPILFISCIDDEEVIVSALRMGGDDYLVKPFTCALLQARIEANLRRVQMERRSAAPASLHFAEFTLDPSDHTLEKNGCCYSLSPIEYQLLCFFLAHPGQYFSLQKLYEQIWNRPSLGDTRTVMVHIHNLRKKLEEDPASPKVLVSARGRGYCFRATPL